MVPDAGSLSRKVRRCEGDQWGMHLLHSNKGDPRPQFNGVIETHRGKVFHSDD
jgi:hypothetical protein